MPGSSHCSGAEERDGSVPLCFLLYGATAHLWRVQKCSWWSLRLCIWDCRHHVSSSLQLWQPISCYCDLCSWLSRYYRKLSARKIFSIFSMLAAGLEGRRPRLKNLGAPWNTYTAIYRQCRQCLIHTSAYILWSWIHLVVFLLDCSTLNFYSEWMWLSVFLLWSDVEKLDKVYLEVKNKKTESESFHYSFTVCISTMFDFNNMLQVTSD